MVAPQHNPLWLAKALATLDVLSKGRLSIVVAVGWVQEEFEALGYSFADRGRRTDEILEILRTSWNDDPTSFEGRHYRFAGVRVMPKPAHPIPVWIGGGSPAALARAVRAGHGFQMALETPETVGAMVEQLRDVRPEQDFVISTRITWAPGEREQVGRWRSEYAEAGVQHLLVELECRDVDTWFEGLEQLATIIAA